MSPGTMYPRVKVREQHDHKSLQEETTKLILSAIESLSLEGDCPSKVPASDPGRNKKDADEDKKPNIRASSVPRPRAVLSSPDNDDMIGHQNRLLTERQRHLKGQILRERASGQSKPKLKNVRVKSPVNTRETMERNSNGSSNHPKTKPLLMLEKTVEKIPRKGKTNPVWI